MQSLGDRTIRLVPKIKLVKDETGVRFVEAMIDKGKSARTKITVEDWQLLVAGTPDQKKQVAFNYCMKLRKQLVKHFGNSIEVVWAEFL